jgi:hypothetical protein
MKSQTKYEKLRIVCVISLGLVLITKGLFYFRDSTQCLQYDIITSNCRNGFLISGGVEILLLTLLTVYLKSITTEDTPHGK